MFVFYNIYRGSKNLKDSSFIFIYIRALLVISWGPLEFLLTRWVVNPKTPYSSASKFDIYQLKSMPSSANPLCTQEHLQKPRPFLLASVSGLRVTSALYMASGPGRPDRQADANHRAPAVASSNFITKMIIYRCKRLPTSSWLKTSSRAICPRPLFTSLKNQSS